MGFAVCYIWHQLGRSLFSQKSDGRSEWPFCEEKKLRRHGCQAPIYLIFGVFGGRNMAVFEEGGAPRPKK